MDIVRSKATLHIFYGAACVGKSTTALRFASEHAIRTIIPTDAIREVQRACTKPSEDSPLMKVSHNSWELFGEPSAENIVKGFRHHVDAVAPALLALARKLSRDGFDAIMEGVHCYGDVLDQFRQVDGLTVRPRLLTVTSESRLLEHIQHKEEERSRASEPKAWKDQSKTIMIIQDFLVQDAIQHRIPIICID